jgi:hypothetical protein
MLRWLRSNCALTAIACLAALYQLLRFSLESSAASQIEAQENCRAISEQTCQAAQNNNLSILDGIWLAAGTSHDAIEALAAVGALIVATLLFVVTAGLWGATRRLAVSTEDLARGASDQSAQMALATSLAHQQHDLALKRHGLQREQFYAQYQPKLEVKFVKRIPPDPNHPSDEQDIGAEFNIANGGESEASVTGSRVLFDWIEPENIPSPNDLKGQDVVPHRRFLVGATDRAEIRSPVEAGLVEAMGPGTKRLYLLGWIVYVDGRGEEFGSTRTTHFLRVWDATYQRFDIVPEWDWNSIH